MTEGEDICITAVGELVRPALDAAALLAEEGIHATVLDMYCVKPFDTDTFVKYASKAKCVMTVEEHAPYGGMGATAAVVLAENCPKPMKLIALPDAPVITGDSKQCFTYYGMDAAGLAKSAKELVERAKKQL